MPEELSNPFGLSGQAGEDPAMIAASYEGQSLKAKHVLDVNGKELGRVSRAFGEEGALTRLDVTLTNQARQLFGVDRITAGVPAASIARVEGDEVRLKEAGEQILRPEDPREIDDAVDERGAPELPRKER